MDEMIQEMLKNKITIYGTDIGISKIPAKWKEDTAYVVVTPTKEGDMYVRNALLGIGVIVDEDTNAHTYTAIVTNNKYISGSAILVAISKGNKVYLASYAKEGLIKQHLSEKALDLVKKRLEY